MQIKIRPLEVSDAKTSYVWRNDPDVWKYTGSRPDRIISVDDETKWIKKVIADDTSRRFAILSDGTYVGNIYLTDITEDEAQYHVFIGDKRYWGKGIAGEASRQIITYATKNLPIKKIYLKVRVDNMAARHVYVKLGFQDEGEEEDNFLKMSLSVRNKDERS